MVAAYPFAFSLNDFPLLRSLRPRVFLKADQYGQTILHKRSPAQLGQLPLLWWEKPTFEGEISLDSRRTLLWRTAGGAICDARWLGDGGGFL
jgi:hypothetical protein